MKNSTRSRTSSIADFAWSAWAELGVPGWERRHSEWCIDPEALMLLTDSFDAEARLVEEAQRWCMEHRALLSRSRWIRLRASWPVAIATPRLTALDGEAAAPVKSRGRFRRLSSPRATRTEATPTRAGWLGLRLRSAFGPTARAELVRILLLGQVPGTATALDYAEEAACTKRNAADALDMLRDAGLVESVEHRNRLHFELRHRTELEATFGSLPGVRTSFAAAARVLVGLTRMEMELASAPTEVRSIEAREWVRRMAGDLRRVGVSPPRIAVGDEGWHALLDWQRDATQALVGSGSAK
ncbi:MAG: hypothetical protein IPJ77_15055 [Planctomycetes bacterium]|nr:hypothetical protein [Planctomycetota bacterium]